MFAEGSTLFAQSLPQNKETPQIGQIRLRACLPGTPKGPRSCTCTACSLRFGTSGHCFGHFGGAVRHTRVQPAARSTLRSADARQQLHEAPWSRNPQSLAARMLFQGTELLPIFWRIFLMRPSYHTPQMYLRMILAIIRAYTSFTSVGRPLWSGVMSLCLFARLCALLTAAR